MLVKLGLVQISRYASVNEATAEIGRDIDQCMQEEVTASLRVSEHPNRLVTGGAIDR